MMSNESEIIRKVNREGKDEGMVHGYSLASPIIIDNNNIVNNTRQDNKNNAILIDSVSGFVSGIAALCVSQPFDTVRVRAQTIDNPIKMIPQLQTTISNNNKTIGATAATSTTNANNVLNTRQNITSTTGGHLYNTIHGTFRGYGLLGFYRGIVPPLVATSIISSTVFSSFEMFKRNMYQFHYKYNSQSNYQFEQQRYNHSHNKNNNPNTLSPIFSSSVLSFSLPLPYIFIAGSCSGFLTSFLTTPLHRVKVQLQTTTSYQYQQHTLRSTITCARKIFKKEGIRNGMYKGWNAQVLSETIGRGVYFGTYELIKRVHFHRCNIDNTVNNCNNNVNISIPLYIRMLAGAISGIVGWTVVYPIDVLKNRIQAEKIGGSDGTRGLKHRQSMKNLYRIGSKLYQKHGIMIFYRGLSVMLVRAFPVSAIALPTYDLVHEQLETFL